MPFQDVPPDFISADRESAARDAADPDVKEDGERRAEHEAEFYDGEKDNDRTQNEPVTVKDQGTPAGQGSEKVEPTTSETKEKTAENGNANEENKMEIEEPMREEKMEVEKKEGPEGDIKSNEASEVESKAVENLDNAEQPRAVAATTSNKEKLGTEEEMKDVDSSNANGKTSEREVRQKVGTAADSAFEKITPKKRPYPSGTECGGFVPEATETQEEAAKTKAASPISATETITAAAESNAANETEESKEEAREHPQV